MTFFQRRAWEVAAEPQRVRLRRAKVAFDHGLVIARLLAAAFVQILGADAH